MTGEIEEPLDAYASDQPEYARAFGSFLTHTDQKTKAIGWLTEFVGRLRLRRLFVDAGAGEGSTTAVLGKFFDRTIAIEPNSASRVELARRYPEGPGWGRTVTRRRVEEYVRSHFTDPRAIACPATRMFSCCDAAKAVVERV